MAARFSYISLSADCFDGIKLRIVEAIRSQIDNSAAEHELQLNAFFKSSNSPRLQRQMENIFTSSTLSNIGEGIAVRDYFSKPRRFVDDPNVAEILTKNELVSHCGFIPVRPNFDRYEVRREAPAGTPIFVSFNLVSPRSLQLDLEFLEHLIESYIIDEYNLYVFENLIEVAADVELETSSIDPMDRLESFVLTQTKRVPEIDVVIWLYSEELEALATEITSIIDFSFDLFGSTDPRWNPIWDVHSNMRSTYIANISKDKRLLFERNADFREACEAHSLRSCALTPLIVRGEARGVVGYFSRNFGKHIDFYDIYLKFMTRQIVRHILDLDRSREFIASQNKIKKLTPLMAIGKEVTQRMHDIRDEINKLNNYFSIIEDSRRYPNRSDLIPVAQRGIQSVERVKQTLGKQLQTFKKAREIKKKVDICRLVRGVIEQAKADAGFDDVKIHFRTSEREMFGRVQQFYFERAISNIVYNAIYFSRMRMEYVEPCVYIDVRLEGSFVAIVICDTGPGIQQVPIEKVFEEGETTKADGFGIGLSIVREIVEDHGGVIRVSNQDGSGARFKLKILSTS